MSKRTKALYLLLGLWLLCMCAANLYSIWANVHFELTVDPAGSYVRNLFTELGNLPAIIAGAADASLLLLCLSHCLIYLTLPAAALAALCCALRGGNGRAHMLLGWILLLRGALSTLQLDPGAIAALLSHSFLSGVAALLVHLLTAFWSAALILTIGRWHTKKSREIPGLISLLTSKKQNQE